MQRYTRWVKLAGLDGLDEEGNRAWFVSSMEPNVLGVVEAIYARTTTFEELVHQVGQVFPLYVPDLTLRSDIQALSPLGVSPTLEEVEHLIIKLETYWARMTDGAVSEQEKMVMLTNKLADATWQALRDSTVWRAFLVVLVVFVHSMTSSKMP